MSSEETRALADVLDGMVGEGTLYERAADNAVRCFACAHRCLIREGLRGICQVRYNRDGGLFVPKGYVAGLQVDPIEKKPFFHFLPGSRALTFGMLGCDFHCSYCQNWLTTQSLRDPSAGVAPTPITAGQMVRAGQRNGARLVVSSYNEPLITSEWAMEIFQIARAKGLRTAYVSNGNATPEVLQYLRPWLDGYKIDLKTMSDRNYRTLGGVLQHVLDTIKLAFAMGFWVEIVTLVVPGFNDSEAELKDAASFIASVSPDIPWHVTAFHKDYRMTEPDNTSALALKQAYEIGLGAGLHYVYVGNLPGRAGQMEDTRCPNCGKTLIRRSGYEILENWLSGSGRCPDCGTVIAGIWQ